MTKPTVCPECGESSSAPAANGRDVICDTCGATFKPGRSTPKPLVESEDDDFGGSAASDAQDPADDWDDLPALEARPSPRAKPKKQRAAPKPVAAPPKPNPIPAAVWGLGAVGVTAVVGICVGLGWWLFGGAGGGAPQGPAGPAAGGPAAAAIAPVKPDDAGRKAKSSGFVVVDRPEPDWPKAQVPVAAVAIFAAPDDQVTAKLVPSRTVLWPVPAWDPANAPSIAVGSMNEYGRVKPALVEIPNNAPVNPAAFQPQWEPIAVDAPVADGPAELKLETPLAVYHDRNSGDPFLDLPKEIMHAGLGGRFVLLRSEVTYGRDVPYEKLEPFAIVQMEVKSKKKPPKKKKDDAAGAANAPTMEDKYVENPEHYHRVFDCATGKQAGQFHWRIGVRGAAALSPDGKTLVGPAINTLKMKNSPEFWKLSGIDPAPYERALGVFGLDEKNPSRWFEAPGQLMWMEFVGPRSVAALFHVGQPAEPVLKVWNVDSGALELDLKLTGVPLTKKGDRYRDELNREDWFKTDNGPAGAEFCTQFPALGCVSSSGKYMALTGTGGIYVIDLQAGKLIGACLPPRGEVIGPQWRVVQFSPNGSELWAVGPDFKPIPGLTRLAESAFYRWNLADGSIKSVMPIAMACDGQIFPTANPSELIFNATFRKLPADHPAGKEPVLAQVIDIDEGVPVAELPYRVVMQAGDDRLVVTVPPEGVAAEPSETRFVLRAFGAGDGVPKPIDWTDRPFPPRPKVKSADRSQVAALTDTGPEAWQALPAFDQPKVVPTEDDKRHQFDTWPASFGLKEAAGLVYGDRLANQVQHEVFWARFDRTTGEPIGPPIKLWSWLHLRQWRLGNRGFWDNIVPPIVALRPDGQQLAICDLEQAGRIDIFGADGVRARGFKLASHAIDGLYWAEPNRLWALANGALSVVDPATGQVLFERAGAYSLIDYVPGRSWLACWNGTAVEILDTTSAKVLNRCVAGGLKGQILHLEVSPGSDRVLAAFSERCDGVQGRGQFSVVVWNLKTGEAAAFAFGEPEESTAQSVHWLDNDLVVTSVGAKSNSKIAATLFDLRVGARVAWNTQNSLGLWCRRSPDGRLWKLISGSEQRHPKGDFVPMGVEKGETGTAAAFHEYVFPGITNDPPTFAAKKRKLMDPRQWPVQVHVKLVDQEVAKLLADAMAQEFIKRGYSIGPGGWVFQFQAGLGASSVGGGNAGQGGLTVASIGCEVTDPLGRVRVSTNSSADWSIKDGKIKDVSGGVGLTTRPYGQVEEDQVEKPLPGFNPGAKNVMNEGERAQREYFAAMAAQLIVMHPLYAELEIDGVPLAIPAELVIR